MRYSETLIPTLKESPAEAEVISHQLMLRAGLIRKLATGIYTWLPMGLRVIRKIEQIVRNQMNRAGAHELLMAGVQPANLWQESGRWEHYGLDLLRFKDRHNHNFCLGPTHEEVISDLVRREVRSYRDLPLMLYQIQTKFRDEIRPRFGVIRSREFLMKDAYSFDLDEAASAISYKMIYEAYKNIFNQLGLYYKIVEADSGNIGGSFSHEFMVIAETGEDNIIICKSCNFVANLEKVPIILREQQSFNSTIKLREVSTPGAHSVEEVANFLKVATQNIAKTIIYLADNQPIAAMVRGDRKINEIKLKKITNASKLVLASPSIIEEITGGPIGFSGPLGLTVPIYADHELALANALIIGANKAFFHLIGFHLNRDLPLAYQVDLRNAALDDPCPHCGQNISFARGIEVGHVFRLGTKYSSALNATYLDNKGQRKPIIMGCYGIGISRIVAAVIEQNHDKNGIVFPLSITPISVAILPLVIDSEVLNIAKRLHDELWAAGVDAILDDRNLRPSIKFKDIDLLGISFRLVISKKTLAKNQVEFKKRINSQVEMLLLDDVVNYICKLAQKGGAQFI